MALNIYIQIKYGNELWHICCNSVFFLFRVNPEKLVSVQQKLEAFLAQEKEQKERAQRVSSSF